MECYVFTIESDMDYGGRQVNRLLVNVDFDGVLIPNYFEKRLIEKLSDTPLDDKISSFHPDVFNWYVDMVNASPLAPLNVSLLKFF